MKKIKFDLKKNWKTILYFSIITIFLITAFVYLGFFFRSKTLVKGYTVSQDGNTITFGQSDQPYLLYPSNGIIEDRGRIDAISSNEFFKSIGSFDGKNIIIENGATVATDGRINLNSLTIKDGGVLKSFNPDYDGNVHIYPTDSFAVKWEGYLNIDQTQTLKISEFRISANSGFKLNISKIVGDNTILICNGEYINEQWGTDNDYVFNLNASNKNYAVLNKYGCKPKQQDDYIRNGYLNSGVYKISLQYQEIKGDAGIAFQFMQDGNEISDNTIYNNVYLSSDKSEITCGTVRGINGFCGKYYFNVPDINNPFVDNLPYQEQRIDNQIKFFWAGATIKTSPGKGLDLNITEDLVLEGNAKIDVSGQGYPGGKYNNINLPKIWWAQWEGTCYGYIYHICGNINKNWQWFENPSGATYLDYSYMNHPDGGGPGGGSGYPDSLGEDKGRLWGGGGGYRGFGGKNNNTYNKQTASNRYPNEVINFSNMENIGYNYGSGGGVGLVDNDGWREKDGAAGGGKVHINARNILLSNNSYILANGQSNVFDTTFEGKSYSSPIAVLDIEERYDGKHYHDSQHARATPGGGSGGTIWLEANNFEFNGVYEPMVDFGHHLGTEERVFLNTITVYSTDGAGATVGEKIIDEGVTPKNLFANGSATFDFGIDKDKNSNSGGGGLIVVRHKDGGGVTNSISIGKTVNTTLLEPSQDQQTVKFTLTVSLTNQATENITAEVEDQISLLEVFQDRSFDFLNDEQEDGVTLTSNDEWYKDALIKWQINFAPGEKEKNITYQATLKPLSEIQSSCGQNVNYAFVSATISGQPSTSQSNNISLVCDSEIQGDIYGANINIPDLTVGNNSVMISGSDTISVNTQGSVKQYTSITINSSNIGSIISTIQNGRNQFAKSISNNEFNVGNWWLDSSEKINKDTNAYHPQGGLWKTNNTSLDIDNTYYQRGTIILPEQEDFTIDKNLKPSTTSDMLGFAKESNNININGTDDDSLDLQLAILAPKSTVNIKTNGGNISLNGLIIAENIKFDLTGGGTVRITYNNSLQSKPLPLFAQTLNLTK